MADESAEMESGLLENVQSAIRRNIELSFIKKAKIEFKGDRSEGRILALSAHRFYVLTISKNGCKVDFSIHILEIQKIESSKPLLITLTCGDKPCYFRVSQPRDSIEIIAHILASLKSNFPSGNPDRLLRVVYGPPEESDERQAQVTTLVNNLRNTEGDIETGPCGGFTKVYVSICDFYGQPHLEEVVWDIDTIYLSLNTKVLNIQDFDHLDQKDLVPIISTLEYNDWFTKVTCDSFKLGSEVCDAIIRVIKKSSSIEELVLDNVGFGRDYCQKLALALTSNPKTALHSLSLNGNAIEDRGVIHLSGVFSKLPHGLVSLSLAENGITSKGASSLGQALKSNKYNESSLQRLDLSKNPFKGEGVAGLCDFLAKPNILTCLDLSSTECPLDLLFGALIRGCAQQLSSIKLAGNNFTSKKSKDAVVPPSFTQFFSSSQALKFLDVSDCKLHADAVRAILQGLHENSVLSDVEINISNNELRGPGAKAISDNISRLKCVSRLDISDNGFEGDLVKILEKLSSNKSLRYLNLGQNTKHARSYAAVMEALVQLISEENSHLESISLAESKLKHELDPLLDALGTNESLKELDISGNQMGDDGARILAKALQINSKLRTLVWDKNGTTYRGFADIAAALENNFTLLSMPMPLYDAAQSLKPQTEQHLRKIEKLLLRNQSPHKIVTDQAYRLQQGLLLASSQQQTVDRLVVQLQDLISELRLSKDTDVKNEIKTAKYFIQDADKLKQLLLKFHLCTNDSDIEARFAELATEFYKAAEDKMKSNLDKMIDCAKEACPYVTSSDDVKSRLEAVVQDKSQLSETFVQEVILSQAAAGIVNRLSENKLTSASVMADVIMEMVIHQLENSASKLELLLRDYRNKMEEEEKDVEKAADEDDVAAVARKARNRLSSSQLVVPVTDGTDGGGRSHRRRPTVSRRPHHGRLEEEKEEEKDKEEVKVDKVDGVEKSPPQIVVKADFTDMEPKASELKHLVKDRARPPQKRRLPTRPSNRTAAANVSNNGDEKAEDENIELFWKKPVDVPNVEVTPEVAQPTRKTSTPKTPPASKTTPPRPAPKPKPSSKTKEPEENKKSSWMPKGGLNIGIPGFLKKKHRDRSATAPGPPESASTAWYTSDAEKKKKGDSPKQSRQRAASENRPDVEKTPPEKKNEKEKVPSVKKPEVSKERTPSEKKVEVKPSEKKPEVAPTEKKPEVTPSEKKPEVAPTEKKPEVTPSEKKPEVTPNEKEPEVTPSETKPAVTPTEKKPEVIPSDKKEETPTEKKGEETIGRRLSDKKPEMVRPPIMGVKPFALPRDRATTDSTVRPSVPHPRDRTATSDKGSSQTTSDEAASAPAPAVKKPPKFGIGMGGLAGGGLLAEMKQRQERAASLKKNKTPEKPAETKPDEKDTGSKGADVEVSKETLVKPSSVKRPRLPSGTPPKPAPRPKPKPAENKQEKPEEKKVEKPEIKLVKKPEEKKVGEPEAKVEEKVGEKKEEEKVTEVDGKKKAVAKEEETVEEGTKPKMGGTEKKASEKESEQLKQEKEAETKDVKSTEDKVDGNNEKRETQKSETIDKGVIGTKRTGTLDDIWVQKESGKQALRPGGRSNSLKVQRTTSIEKTAARSATLPKPWSPGQGPSSLLTRKLSWEPPAVGDEEFVRKEKDRSGNRGEETIQEVAEEQSNKTSIAASEEGKDTKENGTVPKSPKAVSLEDILNDDGDTVL